MRTIKHIAVTAILTLSAFCAILYSSCSKDACKGVTCNNGGTCSGGNCSCPTGAGGSSCDTVYRTYYNNTYVGTGTDNATPANSYTNFRMIFSTPSSSTDFVTMNLTIQDETGGSAGVPVLTITLGNFSASGSSYTITSTSGGGYTYTGSGTISATSASMTLQETSTTSGTTTYYFLNFLKQ